MAGNPPEALTQPTAVVIAANGDVFISEGHNQNPQAPPETVSRISKFTKDGKFIRSLVSWDPGRENLGVLTTWLWMRKDDCLSPTGAT